MFRMKLDKYYALTILFFASITSYAADLKVTSTTPIERSISAPRQTAIIVNFDKPVSRNSITALKSFWAFGRWSGTVQGKFSFQNNDKRVVLTPDKPFSAGETVMVILSHDIKASDGTRLRTAGYSWQFWIKSKPANLDFKIIQSLTTNSTESSRPYGAVATDLNHDNWLDLAVVNEDTADLRIYMNRANNTGQFNFFTQPTTPLGNRASPNEPSDFNLDGNTDLAVVNINDNTISILLGNGNGGFSPQQLITVGSAPRGIALLDIDGDGDIDIVNTNYESNNLSLLINNGQGVFSNSQSFDTGTNGEWALAAADMNEDGLLDIVVGAQDSQQVLTLINNGNGNFQALTPQAVGGNIWMLVIGDVNNDGHEDLATVNSTSDNGSIILGDGTGNFTSTTTITLDTFPLASDLGDLDGDGDLDWVTSSFSGDWVLYSNNSMGQFTFNQRFDAPAAASCAVLFDMDNDLDLDLALIDEIQDTVFIMQNQGIETKSFQINSGLNGAWFNPETPGQGLLLEVFPNSSSLFVAWFTYAVEHSNNPDTTIIGDTEHRWLTAQGNYFGDSANINIISTTGGLFNNNEVAENNMVGNFTITFQDCANGQVEFTFTESGLTGNFPITRVASDNIPQCQMLNNTLKMTK